MSAAVLLVVTCAFAALAAVGLCAAALPRRTALFCAIGAVSCGVGAIAALFGADGAALTLPAGLPGIALRLAIDPLSRPFLVLLFVAGAAALGAATDSQGPADVRTAPFLPVLLASLGLALLAADGAGLLLGLGSAALATWGAMIGSRDGNSGEAASLYLGIAAAGTIALAVGIAVLAPAVPDGSAPALDFAAMRQHPPEGMASVWVLIVTVLGATALAALLPLHPWLPRAQRVLPAPVAALVSGAATKIALYVAARVLFDLCGPATPVWWGVPLVVLGAVSATMGSLRAVLEDEIQAALGAATVAQNGLIAIGLGAALAARGADLPPLAALALGAALLLALAHGLGVTLVVLSAGAAQRAAGSGLLSRLGGLVHTMPVTTGCVVAGCVSLAALPPSSGFASQWMLLQSLLAAPRIGGLGWQMLLAAAITLAALATGLMAAACVRLIGVGFLGRPRVPRTAGAADPGWPTRAALIGLATLSALIGLCPWGVLALVDPALHRFAGDGVVASPLVIAAGRDGPIYAPLAVAALLGLAAVPLLLLRRHKTGERDVAAWGGGFAASPPWLPFGDPTTQYGAASFAQPVRHALGALLRATEHVTPADPGVDAPARLATSISDPAESFLFAPAARLRMRLSDAAEHAHQLGTRRQLSILLTVLVLFLAALALRTAL